MKVMMETKGRWKQGTNSVFSVFYLFIFYSLNFASPLPRTCDAEPALLADALRLGVVRNNALAEAAEPSAAEAAPYLQERE